MRKNIFIVAFSFASFLAVTAFLFAADAPDSSGEEISGRLILQFNDCFNPDRKGPATSYLIRDLQNYTETELDVSGIDVNQLKPGRDVRVQGQHQPNAKSGINGFKVSGLLYEGGDKNASGDSGGATAKSAPTNKVLRVLTIHANTPDATVNMSKVTGMSNMLFSAANNVSNAIFETSYGHYTLTHGATIIVNSSLTASNTQRSAMTTEMESLATAAGHPPSSYDRYIVCCPNGVEDNGGGGWTAYGSYGSGTNDGRRTQWSYGWTAEYFDGIVHELGHNFNFRHSGVGGNQYNDRTCAMGYSHSFSDDRTATYNVVKKVQKGWFNNFPGSYTNLTSDATLYLHPISVCPDITSPGMRGVRLDGSDYYVSYRRQLPPFGWLRTDSDKDKVYVHTAVEYTNYRGESSRVGNLTEGGNYMAGTTNVIFELYGSNMNYVAVSIDFPDINTKPVADAQAVTVNVDTPKAITLTGSDANTNTLRYAVFLEPSNGSLSGIPPDLTYTPGPGYLGADSFVFSVDDGQISSFATVSITVSLPTVSVAATDSTANEEGQESGAWTLTHTGGTTSPVNVFFAMSGSATDPDDYSINAGSPVTIPAGQSNVTVTLTPVDDSVFDEADEDATLTISANAAYVIGSGADTITILENDFQTPVVTNQGATAISNTIASLSGQVTTGGGVTGWICWGDEDGGTGSTGDWDNVVALGPVTKDIPFSTNVTGLLTNASYWYRCYVTNSVGADWSDDSTSFSGIPAGGTVGGDPVSGEDFYLDATQDIDGDGIWEDLAPGNPSGLEALLDSSPAVSRVTGISALPGIGAAYDFPGGSVNNEAGAMIVSVGTSNQRSFQEASGDWSNEDVSIEMWFKPDDLVTTDSNGEILFEDGGGTGLGLFMNDNLLQYRKEPSSGLISFDVTSLASEFIQAMITYDVSTGGMELFVNGASVGSDTASGSDWSGGDAAAIGTRGESNTGGLGNGQQSTQSFDGKISVYRVYRDQLFTVDQVLSNYNSIAGAVAVLANQAPTSISETGAVLNAALSTGATNYSVDVFWGTTDGGTNPVAWDFNTNVGSWTNASLSISYNATLTPGQTYYYAFRASNSSNVWATPSWQFTTPGSISFTTNYTIPYLWLSSINPVWSNDYESAVLSDQDGDGFLTWQEYWSGTDPTDSNSYLKIDQLLPSLTNVMLYWRHAQVDAGLPSIQIQNRASLSAGIWTNIGLNAPAEGTNMWSAPVNVGPYFRLSVPVAP